MGCARVNFGIHPSIFSVKCPFQAPAHVIQFCVLIGLVSNYTPLFTPSPTGPPLQETYDVWSLG